MRLARASRWITSAVTTIQIFAAGIDGTESMSLEVDSVAVQSWNNVGGNAQTGNFNLFEFEVNGAVTADQVRVSFTNDSAERDLRIDKIVVNGVEYQSEASNVFSTGTWTYNQCSPGYFSSEWLNCNGYLQFSTLPRPPGPIPGETGNSDVDSDWAVVFSPVAATDTVALLGPATLADADPGAVTIKYVDSIGFDVRFSEWSGQDDVHATESVDWMLLPKGRFTTNDGSVWEIGSLSVTGNGTWQSQSFNESFSVPPSVFLTIQTNDGAAPLAVRAKNVTASGFEAALFSEELLESTSNPAEVVGYLAVHPAADSGLVTIGNQSYPYLVEDIAVGSSLTNGQVGYSLLASEEQSADDEVFHEPEPTHVLRIGNLTFAQDYVFDSPDPFTLRIEKVPDGIQLPAGFHIRQLISGADFDDAVALAISRDGRIFVAEEGGLVWIVKNGIKLPTPFVDVSGELFRGFADEGALSGIALDPLFAKNGYVYLLYTAIENSVPFGRVSRFKADVLDPDLADPSSQTILLGTNPGNGLIQDVFHNVGDLEFGLDGSLLISWGDTAGNDADDPAQFRSQQLDTPAGKIFRINRFTGAGFASNPFYTGNPQDVRSKVWVYGVRNSFRFAVYPERRPLGSSTGQLSSNKPGVLYLGEVGRHNFDELNVVRGGENLGWPLYEGTQPYRLSGEIIDHTIPIAVFPHPETRCIMGGVFYTGVGWPAEFRDTFLAVDFVEGWFGAFKPNADHSAVTEIPIGSGMRGITDMTYHSGTDRLYFLGRGTDIIFSNDVGLDGLFYLEYVPN